MRCPTLGELPPPPHNETGWPWTEESPQLQDRMPNGAEWPKISIITPNYNYGHFIEETIRSILLQGYPNLEYIIIDGNSIDNSIDIIKKYENWINYWISEPDQGQANAINKGLNYCTGEVFNFINSDDLLNQGALAIIGTSMVNSEALSGGARIYKPVKKEDESFHDVKPRQPLTFKNIIINSHTVQPSIWLQLNKVRKVGFYTEHLHYCFDWEYFLRYFVEDTKVTYTSSALSIVRLHSLRKTNVDNREICRKDILKALQGLLNNNTFSEQHKNIIKLAIEEKEWAYFVNQTLKNNSKSKLKKIINILVLSLEKPKIRINWIINYLYFSKFKKNA